MSGRLGSLAAATQLKRSRPDEFLNPDTRFDETPSKHFVEEVAERAAACDCVSLADFITHLRGQLPADNVVDVTASDVAGVNAVDAAQ